MNHADQLIARLREQDPFPERPVEIPGLFERLTASAPSRAEATPGRLTPIRLTVVLVAVGVLTCAAAVASGVIGSPSPLSLFRANPLAAGTASPLYRQNVIRRSVQLADAVSIPRYGRLELWSATTRQHGWCAAVRLRDGSWYAPDLAGCRPTYEQLNANGPDVAAISGLEVIEADVTADDGRYWRVWYGRVDERHAPGAVRVRDTVSGRSVAVGAGHLFLLPVPDPDPANLRARLVALDAGGRPVSSPVVLSP